MDLRSSPGLALAPRVPPPIGGRFCTRARAEYWGDCRRGRRGSEGGPSPAPCRGLGPQSGAGFLLGKTPRRRCSGAGRAQKRPDPGLAAATRARPLWPQFPHLQRGDAQQARPGRGVHVPRPATEPRVAEASVSPPRPAASRAHHGAAGHRETCTFPAAAARSRPKWSGSRAGQSARGGGGGRPIAVEEGGTQEEGGLTACRKASHGSPQKGRGPCAWASPVICG